MPKIDPLEPGNIEGQNPNTPERLQGEMAPGSDSHSYRTWLAAAAILATGLAMLILFASLG
jgi:hypothetical protein